MRKPLIYFGIAAALVLAACNHNTTTTSTGNNPGKALDSLTDAYYEDGLKLHPYTASANGDNRYNDKAYNDISDSFLNVEKAYYQHYLDAVNKMDTAGLTTSQKLSIAVMREECSLNVEQYQYHFNLMPVNQIFSWTLFFGQVGAGGSIHPFKTVKDYDDFLKRGAVFVSWADTAIGKMKAGIKAGVVLPKILITRCLPQLKDLSTQGEESVFYQPIKNMPKDFSADDQKRLKEAYLKMVNTQIAPAYKRLYVFMQREYLPKGRATDGLESLPNGKAMYAYMVRAMTTTDLTPDSIHALGLKEVARIRKEMEEVKTQVGFKGDLKAFFADLRVNPKLFPYKKPEEVLAGFEDIHKREEPQLKVAFNHVPKVKFEIRETEKFRENSASAEYNQGTPDGSRPGVFYVPIPDATKYSTLSMEELFLHEAIPGHHYQISLAQENTGLPKFRRFGGNNAYVEGWALYTESLGKELGLYKDPYQYMGRLEGEMLRAVRLVVDTGIHHKGMTHDEAIAYMLDNLPESKEEATSAIERYMAGPGQALGYKLGELTIKALRRNAEAKLGKNFSLAEFHDQILDEGSLPLSVLTAHVEEWIASKSASGKQ